MTNETDIIALRQPDSVDDPLTEIARDGARRMLAAALRAEADAVVERHAEDVLPDGRRRVVRHGHGPERSIQTGIGALDVRRPKGRDRAAAPEDETVRFTPAILSKRARRARRLDALLPVLYRRGISTGDFQEALTAIPGTDAPTLSPSVIARLTGESREDYDRWQHRDLSARRCLSGPMAFTFRPGWSRRPSAGWSSSGPRRTAGRRWSACARARIAGARGGSKSRPAASRCRPRSPLATG